MEEILETHAKCSLDPSKHYPFMEKLSQTYPEQIQPLFDLIPASAASTPGRGDRVMLSTKGVDAIMEWKASENKIDYDLYDVCADHEALKDRVAEFASAEDQQSLVCITPGKTDLLTNRGIHFTPVFIQKSADEDYDVFITDSGGAQRSKSDPQADDLDSISFAVAKTVTDGLQQETDKKINIYALANRRQYDFNSCSVFSIRDAINFCKPGMDMKTFVHSQRLSHLDSPQAKFEGLSLRVFSSPPPNMVKVTQSTTQFSRLTELMNPIDSRNIKESMNNAGHLKMIPTDAGSSKEINTLVAERFSKYEAYLIKTALSDI